MPDLISKKQAAEACGVTTRTVERWVKLGIFCQALKMGGRVVFKAADVEDWLQNLPHLMASGQMTSAWPGPELEADETPATASDVADAD